MVTEEFLVLFFSPSGELVVTNDEGVVLVGIDSVVLNIGSHEDILSKQEFFIGSIRETILRHVSNEVHVDFNTN